MIIKCSKRGLVVILTVVVFLLIIAGCGAKQTSILTTKYASMMNANGYEQYKDKPVVISSVTNRAADTTAWAYKDTDKRLWYVMDTSLEEYLTNTLSSAFRKVGMKVYAPPAYKQHYSFGPFFAPIPVGSTKEWEFKLPPGVNEVKIQLNSMSSRIVKFRVDLIRDGVIIYDGELTATVQPKSDDQSDEALAKRAYALVDSMAGSILANPDFAKRMLERN